MDAKDEVKERLRVEDVIGEYVELKRAGRNLKALSPFTNEKTPSFMVSPEKQIWHDFSSNKGGDMFTFVMEVEGVDFRGALEILARKANVDLSQFTGSSQRNAKRKQRLFAANELAVKYYHSSLAQNKTALNYVVQKRGYGQKTIRAFQIGYAPGTGNALINFLTKRGFKDQELTDAGLAVRRGGRLVDMFRARLTIPLHDGSGRAIGFTARVLNDGQPKYINTPQTLIYDKSRHVFGLHLAKEAIRKLRYAIVVEGNMDVIASHKAGVENVVATAGTAMTKSHLATISRLSEDIRLAFDQDRAGLEATERTIPIAQEAGAKLSIISIPSGKDPDELIKLNPKRWQQTVQNSEYVIDWLINHYQQKLNLDTAQGKREFSDIVLRVIARLHDPIEREHYVKRLAEVVDVKPETVEQKLSSISRAKTYRKPKRGEKNEQVDKSAAYQDQLLGLNMLYPDLRDSLDKCQADYFDSEAQRKLFDYIQNQPKKVLNERAPELHGIEEYVKIVIFKTEELYDNWSSSDRMIEAIGLVRRLIHENTQKRQKSLSEQIRRAEDAGDDEAVQKLLRSFHELLKE